MHRGLQGQGCEASNAPAVTDERTIISLFDGCDPRYFSATTRGQNGLCDPGDLEVPTNSLGPPRDRVETRLVRDMERRWLGSQRNHRGPPEKPGAVRRCRLGTTGVCKVKK